MDETRELQRFIESRPEHKGLIRLEKAVCPCCNGTGSTTFGWHNDDAAVFTEDDFMEDPDLGESLMSGMYDKTCPECNGKNVVDVISSDTPEHVLEEWEGWLDAAHESEAVRRMEMRMGA